MKPPHHFTDRGRIIVDTVEFQVEPRKEAILVTDRGKITFSLMYDQAPANVENFIPLGVIPGYSRLTIITPFADGTSATIHSKQPQEVIGSSIIV